MIEAADNASPAASELPRYKCHKEVWALKIARLELRDNPNTEDPKAEFGYMAGTLWLHPADEGYAPFPLPSAWREQWQRKADAGGYYVVYEDGYTSYSPAAPFEAGYAPVADAPLAVMEIREKGDAINFSYTYGDDLSRGGNHMMHWLHRHMPHLGAMAGSEYHAGRQGLQALQVADPQLIDPRTLN